MSHARELPTKIDGISIFDIDKNIELYGGEPIPWVKNLSPGGLYAILDNYGPHPHGMKWGYWKDTLWIVDPPSEIHELLVETLADCLKSALFDFFHDKEFIFYRNLLQSGESRSQYIPTLKAMRHSLTLTSLAVPEFQFTAKLP